MTICASVWEGNDYVPSVWDTWLTEGDDVGHLMVAETDERVIALQHIAMQSRASLPPVGWIEGIRVHSDFRGRGVAGRMLRHAMGLAKTLHATTVRLATSTQNEASAAVARGAGLVEVARFFPFEAVAAIPKAPAGEVETPLRDGDWDRLMEMVPVGRSHSTLVARGWTAYEIPEQLNPTELPIAYRAGDPVRGIVLAEPDEKRDRVVLSYIGGEDDTIRDLASAVRREASNRGLRSVRGMLPRDPATEAGLHEAGFSLNDDHAMIVFEREIESLEDGGRSRQPS